MSAVGDKSVKYENMWHEYRMFVINGMASSFVMFCFKPKLPFELPICFSLVLFAIPRQKHKDKEWKQAVETDNELDILEECAIQYKAKSKDVGRWRQISARRQSQ